MSGVEGIIVDVLATVILLLALMGLAGYCFLSGLDYEIRHTGWGESWRDEQEDPRG